MKIINSRIFKSLVILFILGLFLGVLSYTLFNIKDSSIINYLNLIKNSKFDYITGLINSIKYNLKYIIIIWIFGIIFIFILLIPLIIVFRGISIGFTISIIIASLKLKGIFISLIILFPCVIINEIIYLFSSYYSITFGIKTLKVFKERKSITLNYYIKNYFYRLLFFSLALIISSLIEIYITSNILKFVL